MNIRGAGEAESLRSRSKQRSEKPRSGGEGAAAEPTDRVDRLIDDLQSGKIRYADEIASKVRQQPLSLGNFPCHKYIINADSQLDSRQLPTEIVAKGEKPTYRRSITVDSNLTLTQNEADLAERVESIREQMNELYAQKGESLMVLLEGDNAAGKDGMVKHVFHLNPMTTRGQVAFKAATPEEASHDPNWRVMQNLTGPGQIMFHNRSHYGDVVFAARGEQAKQQRLAEIKELEYGLTMGLPMTPEGRIALPDSRGQVDPSSIQRPPMRFIKVLIGISKEEQAARLAERLLNDDKVYKVSAADLEGRARHDEIQTDFARAMAANSTPWAPTYYLPNDTKLTGRRKLAEIADEILEDIDPTPAPNRDGMSLTQRKKLARELLKEVEKARNE